MLRKLLLQLLLLALPFITYFAYVKLSRRVGQGQGPWHGAPWFWLIVSGLVLSIIGALALITLGGAEPGAKYVPPDWKGGKVIPGHFD